MNCPECDQEMRQGFLFTTKDGAFSFADEVPSMLKNAKHATGFVEITPVKPNHRTRIEAYCCEGVQAGPVPLLVLKRFRCTFVY